MPAIKKCVSRLVLIRIVGFTNVVESTGIEKALKETSQSMGIIYRPCVMDMYLKFSRGMCRFY